MTKMLMGIQEMPALSDCKMLLVEESKDSLVILDSKDLLDNKDLLDLRVTD